MKTVEVKNVVIYARFSCAKQTEQSIEGQLLECYAYAEKNGYTIVGEYIDKGKTGRNEKRPEFQRMIADSSKKLFQAVLLYSLDRFARKLKDSVMYDEILEKNGVEIISAKENISSASPSGMLHKNMLKVMADYYSVELAQKVSRDMRIMATKCLYLGNGIPLGYKVVDKHYVIDEATAPIVQMIFKMYVSDNSVTKITTKLNDMKIKTSKGGEFNKNSLYTILRNKKYIGTYVYDDIVVPDGVPRIIDDNLYNQVQMILEKNKNCPARKRAKEEYLLTTKLFCGYCGSADVMMTGNKGRSHTGKQYCYYICNNARNSQTKKRTCKKKQVSKHYIEELVIEKCREFLTAENIDLIAKSIMEEYEKTAENLSLKHLEKQMQENERNRKNLFKAVADCDDDNIRKAFYENIKNLNIERTNIEKLLVAEQVKDIILTKAHIKLFLTDLKQGKADNIQFRKRLINLFINRILLYDDRITFIMNCADKGFQLTETLFSYIIAQSLFFGVEGSP